MYYWCFMSCLSELYDVILSIFSPFLVVLPIMFFYFLFTLLFTFLFMYLFIFWLLWLWFFFFRLSSFDDFWNAFLFIDNSEYPFIKDMMDPWTQMIHYPVVKVTQKNLPFVEVSIANLLDQGTVGIPLTFTHNIFTNIYTQHYSNFSNTRPMKWLIPSVMNMYTNSTLLSSNSEDLIIINIQQAGECHNKIKFPNFFSGYFLI